jgi:diadenosine tetraphosphate (Ap4A) HIT family hydrolase
MQWPGRALSRAKVADSGADCPCCDRIANGKATHSVGTAVAFPDGFPVVEGHTLIVPRRHEADFLALTDEETADMRTGMTKSTSWRCLSRQ